MFCDSCQHEPAATLDGRATLNLAFPAAKRARAGRRICRSAARGQAPPSARAALAGCPSLVCHTTSHLLPHTGSCCGLPPCDLYRPNAVAHHVRPLPPYAWPTSTQHPLDGGGSSAPPPDVARAAGSATLHNAHSELHAAAADDGACFRLHEHGRCFESGAANHRHLRRRSHA